MHTPEMISLRGILMCAPGLLSEHLLRLRLGIAQAAKNACFIAAHVESLD